MRVFYKGCRALLLLGWICFHLAPPVFAADAPPAPEGEEFLFFTEEDMASISSLRTKPISASPGFVTVVTSKTISAMAARNLTDVLQTLPGFSVGYGNSGEYSLAVLGNGTPSNILVMVNGHRLNNLFDGAAVYDLPVDWIDRIEIIRGPGSAMYGTNAMAGVVNVITKTNDHSSARGGIGNFYTKKAEVNFGSKTETGGISLSAEWYGTAGADTVMPNDRLSNNPATAAYSMAPAAAKDNKSNFAGNVGWEYRGTKTELVFLNREQGPNYAYENIIANGSSTASRYISLDVAHPFGSPDKLLVEPRLYGDIWSFDRKIQLYPAGYTDNRDLNGDGQPEYFPNGEWIHKKYDIVTGGAEVKFGGALSDQNYLSAGLSVENSSIRNTSVLTNYSGEPDIGAIPQASFANWNNYGFSPYSRTVWAAFLQEDISAGKHFNLVAGVRHDAYSDFGNATSPRVAVGIFPTEKVDLKFQYASSFRAPTFSELYDKSNLQFYGNPNLLPETLETWEAGAGYTYAKNSFARIGVFRNIVKNYITTLFNTSLATSTAFQNAGTIETNGEFIETRHSFTDNSSLAMNATLFGAKDRISNTWLTSVPQFRFNASLIYQVRERLTLSADLIRSDSVASNARTSMEQLVNYRAMAGPFNILNLALAKKDLWANGVNAKFSVFNLLNSDYREMFTDVRYMFPTAASLSPSSQNLVRTNQRIFFLELEKEF